MTERNKKRMAIINKKINSMSWNEYISRQIENSKNSERDWRCNRWLTSIGIEDDIEMELICSIVASLIPS